MGDRSETDVVLFGSSAQVAWARRIRAGKLREAERRYGRPSLFPELVEQVRPALEALRAEQSASWWIDHRDEDVGELLARQNHELVRLGVDPGP